MISEDQRDRLLWMGLAGLAGAAAMAISRPGLKAGWRLLRHDDPPENPVSPDVTWGEAVAWSMATGAILGVAHMAAQRAAATGWERWRGGRPPGL